MTSFAELRFAPELLARHRLPDNGYPVPVGAIDAVLGGGGSLPFSLMLSWLQQRSRSDRHAWRSDELAMAGLAELIAPADERNPVTAEGDDWWIEIGDVNLRGPIVTIQREEELIAAMSQRSDGRLRAAAYRPFDAKSIGYLTRLAQKPLPGHGVCMRENNWEFALDSSAGMGNLYAAQRGEPYLSLWEFGIGNLSDGTTVPTWFAMQDLRTRRPAVVAMEIGIHFGFEAEPSSLLIS